MLRSLKRCSLTLTAVALVASPVPVRAIVFGFVDQTNRFPNVGAFIVQAPNGRIFPICSGTLIATDAFLTAAHCTSFFEIALAPQGYTAFVSFDNPIPFGSLTNPSTTLIPVTQAVTSPAFNQAQSDSGDIGYLLAAGYTTGITPAMLPEAGLLGQRAARNGLKAATFIVVGYGVQGRVTGGGPPFFLEANPIPRMYAFGTFNALNPGYIRLSQNPALGKWGACYGDSGGPNLLETNQARVLAAITITGDTPCRATNVAYRLDTESARAFLAQFITVPYWMLRPGGRGRLGRRYARMSGQAIRLCQGSSRICRRDCIVPGNLSFACLRLAGLPSCPPPRVRRCGKISLKRSREGGKLTRRRCSREPKVGKEGGGRRNPYIKSPAAT